MKILDKLFARNILKNTLLFLTCILPVLLLSTLMATIKTLQASTIQTKIIQSGSYAQVSIKNLTQSDIDYLDQDNTVENIGITYYFGHDVQFSEKPLSTPSELRWMNDTYLDQMNVEFVEGGVPEDKNSIALPKKVLEEYFPNASIGDSISFSFIDENKKENKQQAILSGVWENDFVLEGSYPVIVIAFSMDTIPTEIPISYDVTFDFKENKNLDQQLESVISNLGYTRTSNIDEATQTIKYANVNPAYEKSSVLSGSLFSAILGIIFILLFSFLMVYGIYYSFYKKDVQLYGQLKLIGATGKQIQKSLFKNLFFLTFLSYITGIVIFEFVFQTKISYVLSTLLTTTKPLEEVHLSFVTYIVIALVLFLTVFLSSNKSIKKAKNLSPLDGSKYQNIRDSKRKVKRQPFVSINYLAATYVKRFRKKNILIGLLVTFSLLLVFVFGNIYLGFDEEKYIYENSASDFLIASKNYFNFQYSDEDSLSQDIIKDLSQYSVSEDEQGALYHNLKTFSTVQLRMDSPEPPRLSLLFGVDPFVESTFKFKEENIGPIDSNTVDNVIPVYQGVLEGSEYYNFSYNLGDRITLYPLNEEDEGLNLPVILEIRGVIFVDNSITSRYYGQDLFYMSSENYKNLFSNPSVMSYLFNAPENELENVNDRLNSDPLLDISGMGVESVLSLKKNVENLQTVFEFIGKYSLIIVLLIVICIWIYTVISNLYTCSYEISIFESIGMTKRQQLAFIYKENLIILLPSLLTTYICSFLVSNTLFVNISNSMQFLTIDTQYYFLSGMCLFYVFLLLFIILIGYIFIFKKPLTERIK